MLFCHRQLWTSGKCLLDLACALLKELKFYIGSKRWIRNQGSDNRNVVIHRQLKLQGFRQNQVAAHRPPYVSIVIQHKLLQNLLGKRPITCQTLTNKRIAIGCQLLLKICPFRQACQLGAKLFGKSTVIDLANQQIFRCIAVQAGQLE
ncbi:hypothetical protein D3C85_1096310 [compost metagenome]